MRTIKNDSREIFPSTATTLMRQQLFFVLHGNAPNFCILYTNFCAFFFSSAKKRGNLLKITANFSSMEAKLILLFLKVVLFMLWQQKVYHVKNWYSLDVKCLTFTSIKEVISWGYKEVMQILLFKLFLYETFPLCRFFSVYRVNNRCHEDKSTNL